ncbi:MAG TPA: hypothetical protein VGD45_20330 [Steroidobacter sp.]|uniref:hypothetical protein n=1 Tax=Steroidobacter sp. TaxID=1978227 RepID=UPI002ED9B6FE
MSDTYQAIYDAVRSRLHGCDVGQAIRDAAHLDASYAIEGIRQDFAAAAGEISAAGGEMRRPSVLYRPALSIDGDHWCALYGENLQDGVAGFGKSPAAAMTDFDVNWHKALHA